MNKPVSQVLEEAAEVLETSGWCQGIFQNIRGEHCMAGAIGKVVLEDDQISHATMLNWRFIPAVIALEKELPGIYIPNWNDATGRTKEEVVDKLMDVAKKLRNEGK